MDITLPLIRSTRIGKKWTGKGTEVTLPASQMRQLAQGNSPKVDPAALEKALAAAPKASAEAGKAKS